MNFPRCRVAGEHFRSSDVQLFCLPDSILTSFAPKPLLVSSEIFAVYDSLEKLCKIVRFSNAAFFKGDRTKSYRVMEDALELFVQMGNQKGTHSVFFVVHVSDTFMHTLTKLLLFTCCSSWSS